MPKIVDVEERRALIAHAACRAIARKGIVGTTMTDIAKEAGVTTGMIANYFENKAAIIEAALRVPFAIVNAQIESLITQGIDDLALLLDETIPTSSENKRYVTVWVSFWGVIATDANFRELNRALHEEGLEIYARAMRAAWPESVDWDRTTFAEARRLITTFIFGLSAGGVTNPGIWTSETQRKLLRHHLTFVRDWANGAGYAVP